MEPEAMSHGGRSPNTFRQRGDFWEVVYEGRGALVRDSKGLRYLAQLLARPNHAIHVFDLVESERAPGSAPAIGDGELTLRGRLGLDPTLDAADARARATYRARLRSLEDAKQVATAAGAPEVVGAVEREIAAVVHELTSRADGPARGAAERARKAVSNRIRSEIAHLRKIHPEVARHLTNSVRMGACCSYEPERATRWKLR